MQYTTGRSSLKDDADPLAGDWDESALDRLVAVALSCIETEVEDRPKITSVVGTLQDIEESLKSQEERVQTKTRSETTTRLLSPNAETCRVCFQQEETCFPCNFTEDPHYHCSDCLTRHVQLQAGCQSISCPKGDCYSPAFSSDQLQSMIPGQVFVEHLRASLFTDHVEQVIARELSSHLNHVSAKIDNAYLAQTAKIDQVNHLLTYVGAGQLVRCPRHFLLVEAETKNGFRHPRSWLRSKARSKFRLYPVCAHSFRVVDPPVKITVTRDWVDAIAPALMLSISLIQFAGQQVTGLEFDLSLDNLMGMHDELKHCLSSSDVEVLDRARRGLAGAGEIQKVTGAAYTMITERMHDTKNKFLDHMSPVIIDGDIDWVLHQYRDGYDNRFEFKADDRAMEPNSHASRDDDSQDSYSV